MALDRKGLAFVGVIVLALVAGVLIGHAASTSARDQVDAYIVLYNDGSWSYAATAMSTRTPSPPPTHTPTATVTATPAPSITPLYGTPATRPPTLTPTFTIPAPVTPTPDVQTPEPTLTPSTPEAEVCYAGTQYNLNVRSGPGTNYSIVGRLTGSTRVEIVALYVAANGDEWGKLGEGRWIALVYGGTTLAYLDDSATCWELPQSGPGAQTVPRVGFKVVPGARLSDLLAFDAALPDNTGSVAFVVQDTNLTRQLYDTDIYTVFVPWTTYPGDCPNTAMSPANSAGDRLRYVESQAQGAPFDAVVLTNECAWPSAAYYRDWLLAAVAGCNARGWTCIPQVHNTGSPPLEWLPVLEPALCALAESGHYWGYNVYSYWPVSLMTRDDRTQYTTWRHELTQSRMACAPQWAVTELAPDGGGWSPAVADTAAYINATRGDFALVGVWYAGNALSAWPDARWGGAQMVELAGCIQ